MGYRPRRTRKDRNQAQIVRELRSLGAVVWDLADMGGEVLDLLVCWRGKCLPVEIKRPGCEEDLTHGEIVALLELGSVGVEALVATCTEDVLQAFGAVP